MSEIPDQSENNAQFEPGDGSDPQPSKPSESLPLQSARQAFNDSSAHQVMKDLINPPAMRAMKDLINPPAMRAMKDLIDPPAMRAMKDLIDPPAMRAMKDLIDSPALRAMRDLIDSPAMRSVRAFSNARSMAVTMAFDDVLRAGTNERFDAYSLTGGPLDRLIDHSLSTAALFQSIASVEPARLEMIARLAAQQNRADSTANSLPRDRPNVSHAKATPTTIEAEIERALTGDAPTTPLSKEAFVVLRWIVAVLLTFYNAIAAWPDFQAGLCDFQTRLISANSLAEVRHLIQQNVCEIPRAVMKNLRYTGDEGARLYERPAIQSTILETLPRGVVLVVLDSSNRDWLFVHVTYDDEELEGWISRKFTKRFVQ